MFSQHNISAESFKTKWRITNEAIILDHYFEEGLRKALFFIHVLSLIKEPNEAYK